MKLEVYNCISISSILSRYQRHYAVPEVAPTEQRKLILEFLVKMETNEVYYEELRRVLESVEKASKGHNLVAENGDFLDFLTSSLSSSKQYRELKRVRDVCVT